MNAGELRDAATTLARLAGNPERAGHLDEVTADWDGAGLEPRREDTTEEGTAVVVAGDGATHYLARVTIDAGTVRIGAWTECLPRPDDVRNGIERRDVFLDRVDPDGERFDDL